MKGGLSFESDNMEINVSRYSIKALMDANHQDELKKDGLTHIRVDYKNSGTGSASCGTRLDDKYKLKEKEIEFEFSIM